MGLYERLIGIEEPVIRVHPFCALMTERKRGQVTNQQIIDAFALTAGEQTELVALWNRVSANQLTGPEVHDVLLIAQQARFAGLYDTVARVKTRLGV